jgi:ATP-dependent Clp protease protease subunit
MTKTLVRGLKGIFAVSALSLAFTATGTDKLAGIGDIPAEDIPEMDFPTPSPTPPKPVTAQMVLRQAAAAASEEESIIPISGQVVPGTQPLMPSGTLDLVRSGLKHYNEDAPNKPITLEINTPGGDGVTMFSIINAMAMSKNQVNTRCIGYAMSAGAFILMSGKLREAWSSCGLMLHNVQTQGPTLSGAGIDILKESKVHSIQIQDAMNRARDIMVRETGLPVDVTEAILAQDCQMPVDAAKALNIIDKIIDPRDPQANTRKFTPTADNICIGYTLSDDIVRKVKTFVAAPRPQR